MGCAEVMGAFDTDMQGICHNNDLTVDNTTPTTSSYPYTPTIARRPEVVPNLGVVANATSLDYTHTLGRCDQNTTKPLKCSMFERFGKLLHMQQVCAYAQISLISLMFLRPIRSAISQVHRRHRERGRYTGGYRRWIRVGVYPPMVKWGRESGRGVEARSQVLPNCQIALF